MPPASYYPYALYTLGLVRRAQGDYGVAEAHLRRSQEIAASNGDSFMEAYALSLLGEVLADQDKQEQARQALRQALEQFRQLDIRSEIDRIQNLLNKIG